MRKFSWEWYKKRRLKFLLAYIDFIQLFEIQIEAPGKKLNI